MRGKRLELAEGMHVPFKTLTPQANFYWDYRGELHSQFGIRRAVG